MKSLDMKNTTSDIKSLSWGWFISIGTGHTVSKQETEVWTLSSLQNMAEKWNPGNQEKEKDPDISIPEEERLKEWVWEEFGRR